MMKKIIIGLCSLLLVLGCFSCEDSSVEDTFGISSEKRVEGTLDSIHSILKSSPYGWTAYFLFNNNNNDSYFNIRFLPEGNRAVVSYIREKQVLSSECSYSIRYGHHMELVFDTYSPFADLVNKADNGDFRFALQEYNTERFVFSTFKDTQNGVGTLHLSRSESLEEFDRLQTMRTRVANDLNRSFYRLLQLDGSKKKYVFRYQVDAVIDWLEGGEIKTVSSPVEVSPNGFSLVQPLELEGHQIDNFLYNAADSNFIARVGEERVGILDYTLEKPFTYPKAVKLFMDKIGADTSSIMIAPIAFSPALQKKFDMLLLSDPTLLQIVIEPCLHWCVFSSKSSYNNTAYYRIDTEYWEDAMCFVWVGTATDGGYSRKYYEKGAWHFIDEILTDKDNLIPGTDINKLIYSIVPRGDYFYFVRDDDPTISFVGKPQFRDAW